MKIDVTGQKKNPLMKREELWVEIEHEGAATPRRKELVPHLVKTLKTKDNLVIIRKIFSETGRNRSRAKVFAYSKTEDIPKALAEKMQRQLKKGKQPEAKAEEKKPVEAPKAEEKPKEEPKKEEKPAEKKEEPKEEKPAEAPKAEKKAEEKPKTEEKKA